jgi:hypothetical protein
MSKFLSVLGSLLLLAPAAHAALSISSDATENVACAAGKCASTAKTAVLNADDLAAMLASSNVVVQTGGGAQTIEIAAPLAWASHHVLTLKAKLDVDIEAPVAVEGLGGVTVTTNFGKTGSGDLAFFPGGKIDFWDTGARFVLNGKSHVLVNDIATMAADYAANGGAALALAKDYDAAPDGVYSHAAFVGTMYGTFEGLGHTIANFSAAGNNGPVGFFFRSASVAGQAPNVIRDITLSNVNIAGEQAYYGDGALAGDADGTLIVGAHSSGAVKGIAHTAVGGLVGSGGTLERGATFTRSDSTAAMICATRCTAGGLEGIGGSFLLCHAGAAVTVGASSLAGGLVGSTSGSIVQSYATGDVATSKTDSQYPDLGGLAGALFLDGSIADSYSLGAVRNAGNKAAIGGFIGFEQEMSTVTHAYAAGAVGSTTPGHSGPPVIGGFIGVVSGDEGGYTGAYWDVDTSGTALGCGQSTPANDCPVTTGLSDTALKSGLPSGFDPAIWAQSASVNDGYPYLIANPPQ